ncbi:MAG: methylenetetrahydrofolate--tRNA-(uracil(54)-C(5))-methyltransferase (FADH(2)-oxidizing) TrmFO [Candidatus Cloacimonetes bacterium]|nr:methylenetetrahydrofolate--tRNA-(uracil(54)-C(5))-methyltransferase (FADH(2)-oxidizing) TrmFO [Candidatus Cloacimonadota bacterium]
MNITIIGAGLAGSEAALQLSKHGVDVTLIEMRPETTTPAHTTGFAAEMVCSNSLKSRLPGTAAGLLKSELRLLGCELLPIAQAHSVPAGNALAVDREAFAVAVTQRLTDDARISFIRAEVKEIPSGKVIIATGPLTPDALTEKLIALSGAEHLYFFDAIAPIVAADSIDMRICFKKSRYDKGDDDYINCPFEKDEYYNFVSALREGDKHEAKEFENKFFENIGFRFYENCIPVEELARRGEDTLRYGVMRPVGLERDGKRFYGVLQLRPETASLTAYNLVGCQTMLKYPEQKRILHLIPGLQNAEILRYGSIHRNTYLNSPNILNPDMSFREKSDCYLAGQLTGVEGYVESIYSGLLTALNILGKLPSLPDETICGQLRRHLLTPSKNFQPANANFGLLPPLETRIRAKPERKKAMADRALEKMEEWVTQNNKIIE